MFKRNAIGLRYTGDDRKITYSIASETISRTISFPPRSLTQNDDLDR